MSVIETKNIECPYCGEVIEILLDCSVSHQSYIEDCQVCCRPININMSLDERGELSVIVTHENE